MAVSNSLVQSRGGKPKTFSAFLTSDAIKHKINEMVGGRDGQRFITSIISAVSTNPVLSECEHSTILSAAMLGESLKLSPSPQLGQYYMVPFKDKKRGCKVAQFQLGYKGYIQLAIRSGYYKKLNVLAIKQGELIRFDPLEEEIEVNLVENDTEREALPTIGYYAMFEYQNGFKKAMYWSREKMMAHANKYSMAFSAKAFEKLQAGEIPEKDLWKYSSFWYKDFDGMAYKTMLRQLISKWGIMSIDLQKAMDGDMGTINEDGSVDYVDNYAADESPAPAEEPAPVVVDESTGEIIEEAPAPVGDDPTADFFNQEG
jgi:recombination protein RecT